MFDGGRLDFLRGDDPQTCWPLPPEYVQFSEKLKYNANATNPKKHGKPQKMLYMGV